MVVESSTRATAPVRHSSRQRPRAKGSSAAGAGLLLLAAVGLAGCAGPAAVLTGYAAAEGVSLVTTDKLIEDHVASSSRAQECSTVGALEGKPYCKDRAAAPAREAAYCYRTLGRVECFDQPDPSRSSVADFGARAGSAPQGGRTQARPAGVR